MAAPTWYNQGDQDIYQGGQHFISPEAYRLDYKAPLPTSETETVTQTYGIPYTNAFTGGGGGGGGSLNTNQLIGNFYDATANRQKSLENPGWIQQQVNKFTGGGQRPVSEMMSPQDLNYSRSYNDVIKAGEQNAAGMTSFGLPFEGQESGAFGNMPGAIEGDVRRTSGLPFGIGALIARGLPDKYYDMPVGDQTFIQSQMGYTDPGSNIGNKDPFGRNVRSMFGDYAEGQEKSIAKMDERMKSENFIGKYGNLSLEEDEEGNWSFVGGPGAAEANRMNKLNLQRYTFDKRGLSKRDLIKQNVATQKKRRIAYEKETGRELDAADAAAWGPDGSGDYDESSGAGGTPNYSIPAPTYSYEGSDEQDKANEGPDTPSGVAAGTGASGPPGRNYKKAGGRIGYRDGEFVDENINVEGPNFDVNENIEMAEGPSPFEMRIEELMDEGMSWEEAYNIASQEFSRAEGPEESFSEEGIASIV